MRPQQVPIVPHQLGTGCNTTGNGTEPGHNSTDPSGGAGDEGCVQGGKAAAAVVSL